MFGFVDEVEVVGLIHGRFDFFGQFQAAFAAFGPDFGEGNFSAALVAGSFDEVEFFLGVGGESVDGHDSRQTEFMDVFNVFFEVLHTAFQGFHIDLAEVFFIHAAVHFEGADGGNDNHGIGL